MTLPRCLLMAVPTVLLCLALSLQSVAAPANNPATSTSTIEFAPEGAVTPEIAATTLFRACTARSPKHFAQHLLLGVCDGPIASVNKYAEALHTITYTDGNDHYTVYELRELGRGIHHEAPIRVVASAAFDTDDKQVAALQLQMASTYYGKKLTCVDVAAKGDSGVEYQTRIVVAQNGDGWYAMPRCRSAHSFYEIADAMRLTPAASKRAK